MDFDNTAVKLSASAGVPRIPVYRLRPQVWAAALIARLDTKPTKDDWVRYNAGLESRIAF